MSQPQRETLEIFTALFLARAAGPGMLMLSLGFSGGGPALAMANSGLGGACLTLESDAALLRDAGRAGASDFTVETVSEALRILKNEVRKAMPVSVAVRGEQEASLAELLQRGVEPAAVFVQQAADRVKCGAWIGRGALVVEWPAEVHPSQLLREWVMETDRAATIRERREQDQSLRRAASADPALNRSLVEINRRWLQVAPRMFPRDLERAVWRMEEENDA